MKSIEVEGMITFLYYKDLKKAVEFYEDTMGFKLATDQGWAKIYKVAEKAHIGLVDEMRGYHKSSPTKPVMITLLVPDVDAWHSYLKGKNVEVLSEPHDVKELRIRCFLLKDPEGYVIEVQEFL